MVILPDRPNRRWLRDLRIANGLTQQQLADICETTVDVIYAYETGRREIQGMRACTAYKMAKAFNITVEKLLLLDESS